MKKLTIQIITVLMSVMAYAGPDFVRHDAGVAGSPGHIFKRSYSAAAGIEAVNVEVVPESPVMCAAKARAEAGAELVAVTVITDPDKDGLNGKPFGIDLIRADGVSWNEMFASEAVLNVPKGEYLLQVTFVDGGLAVLFFPDLTVDKPMELHVCRDMATNTLAVDPLLPDGSSLLLPERDSEGVISDDDYNTLGFNGVLEVRYKGKSKCSYIMEADTENSPFRGELAIHTNINDGNATFYWLVDFVTRDGAHPLFYVASPADAVHENGVVSNDCSKYRKVDLDFVHSPVYAEHGNGNNGLDVMCYIYNGNNEQIQGKGFWSAAPVELYLCNEMGEYAGSYTLAHISSIDMMQGFSPVGIEAPGLTCKDGELLFVSNQNGNTYATPVGGGNMSFSMNPVFSFEAFSGCEFGNSSAYCVTGSQFIDWSEVPFESLFIVNYYGNAGEKRDVDFNMSEVEIVIDGEIVLSRCPNWSVFDWAQERSVTEHEKAKVSYVYYNGNMDVDGIKGQNICTVTIDERNDDREAPTLQRLMFKDKSGNPSVRFDSPSDGFVSIAGGDFMSNRYIMETAHGEYAAYYYTYAPADIVVEYAPHGSSDYSRLDVVENPDAFLMPGYGACWDGALAGVDRLSPDGWYDLRVALTDAAGNAQVQVISPAFRINELASVSEVDADVQAPCVRVENGRIIAPAGARIFDISGRRVGATPGRGVYIVELDGSQIKVAI